MLWLGAVFLVAFFTLNAAVIVLFLFNPKWKRWLDQLDARNRPIAWMLFWLLSAVAFSTSAQCLYLFGIGPGVTSDTAIDWGLVTVMAFGVWEAAWFLSRRVSHPKP